MPPYGGCVQGGGADPSTGLRPVPLPLAGEVFWTANGRPYGGCVRGGRRPGVRPPYGGVGGASEAGADPSTGLRPVPLPLAGEVFLDGQWPPLRTGA